MKEIDRTQYPQEKIERLFSATTFFKDLMQRDDAQFRVLLGLADIVQAESGETVIREGDSDSCLYFLLTGQLVVEAGGRPINYISPGEVFGALAMLRGTPRTATIRVDENTRLAIVARLDYAHFRDQDAFSPLTLRTRVLFYRMLVHNIRWTLEASRMQNPGHALAGELRKLPLYNGVRGGAEELDALQEQAHALADLLCRWNETGQERATNLQVT